VLAWLQAHPRRAEMKESRGRLSMTFKHVFSIAKMRSLLLDLAGLPVQSA